MDNIKSVKIDTIKQIYSHLLYSLTNDCEYLRKVIYTPDEGLKIKYLIDANKKVNFTMVFQL